MLFVSTCVLPAAYFGISSHLSLTSCGFIWMQIVELCYKNFTVLYDMYLPRKGVKHLEVIHMTTESDIFGIDYRVCQPRITLHKMLLM